MSAGASPADRLVGQTIEKCRILSKIARGGMGDIYLAEHTALRRRVAIKVLPADLARNRSYVDRFRREAIAAARIEHPNIVQVYDVGEHEGTPFIVMQFVEGFSLSEILKRSGKLETKEACRIARDVARGLAAAHAEGIVHRDIKPDNILVSEQSEVRITDFGIAHDSEGESQIDKPGARSGTPNFISPEQAEGRKSDPRTDLYSLGATLFTLLTGKPPFAGETPVAVMYKHVHEAPRRPSTFVPEIPRVLDDIVLRLLNKKPDARYQKAEELERDLDRMARGIFSRGTHGSLHDAPPPRKSGSALPSVKAPIPRRAAPPKTALLSLAAGGVVLVVALLFAFWPSKKEPVKPAPVDPTASPKAPDDRARAQEAEDRGEFEAALSLFKKIGDAEGARRMEQAVRRLQEERAIREVEEAFKSNSPQFAAKAEAFLRDFSDSRHGGDVREMVRLLAKRATPPVAETGFVPLYAGASDALLWEVTIDLAKKVNFLRDVIAVSFFAGGADPDVDEFLVLRESDLEEFVLRLDILPKAGTFGAAAGVRLRGEPAVTGRKGWTGVPLDRLVRNVWHPLEVAVQGGKVRVTAKGEVLSETAIKPEGSPFGHAGFSCRAGADFEVRNPRLRILKRFDLSTIGREPAPPVKPPDAPPKPDVSPSATDSAKPPKPDPGTVPAAALQAVRDRAYAQAAGLLKDAPGDLPRRLLERVEGALAIHREARALLKKGQRIDLAPRTGAKMNVEFIEMTDAEVSFLHLGGKVRRKLADLAPSFFLDAVKSSKTVTRLQRATFLALEDDPVSALETLAGEEAPGHREDIEEAARAQVEALTAAKKTKEAEALKKRLSAIKPAASSPVKPKESEPRPEEAEAKTDLDKARLLIKAAKYAEAEDLLNRAMSGAKPAEASALAKALRDAVLGRPSVELYDGKSLDAWQTNAGSKDVPKPAGGQIDLPCQGRFVHLWHEKMAAAQGLTFEIRVAKFHAKKGAGLRIQHKDDQNTRLLIVYPTSADIRECSGGKWEAPASRPITPTPDKWFRVQVVASAGQVYAFVDDELLWKAASPEAAMGPNAVFIAQDTDCSIRSIRAVTRE